MGGSDQDEDEKVPLPRVAAWGAATRVAGVFTRVRGGEVMR